jgi:hypothetical protein
MGDWIRGKVVAGHGVASGRAKQDRFPGGTIAIQRRAFRARGFELGPAHDGTINLDIAPLRLELRAPRVTLELVEWLPGYPAETFSFADALLRFGGDTYPALLYHPHPETKPEHGQPPSVIELLAPWIEGITLGAAVEVRVDPAQTAVVRPPRLPVH